MKKGLMIFELCFLLIGMIGLVSAFDADSYYFNSDFNCSDFGLECGIASIYLPEGYIKNSTNFNGFIPKSCGECTDMDFCYNGKCIVKSALGICSRKEGFN